MKPDSRHIVSGAGLLLVFVLHCWGAFAISLQDYLLGVILIFSGQFAWGLQIQYRLNDGFFLQDIRLWFLVFYFLYGIMLPVSTWAGYGDQHGFSANDYGLLWAVALYASGAAAFNIAQLVWPIKWADPNVESGIQEEYSPLSLLTLLGLLYWLLSHAISLGVEFKFDLDGSARYNLAVQTWVVAVFCIQGVFYYLIWNYSRLKSFSRIILFTELMFFVLFSVFTLGGRRSFLPLLIFAIAVFQSRTRGKVGFKVALLMPLMLAGLLYIGTVRERKYFPDRSFVEEVVVTFSANEFSIPIQNLVAYISTPNLWDLRLGLTYVYWPEYFVPRVWWPEKPVSLSEQVKGDTGWGVPAYTPVGEAFLNFAWVGPFFIIGAFSFLLSLLVYKSRIYPAIYFICLSVILDFNRGEFGGTMYGLVIVFAMFQVMRVFRNISFVK